MNDIANQSWAVAEDAVNKPWRPIPSGRITPAQAKMLRWVCVGAAFAFSAVLDWSAGPQSDWDLVWVSLWLLFASLAHEEGGLTENALGKNVCNVAGYVLFEIGATKLVGRS